MNAPPFTPTCNVKGFAGQVVAIRYLEDGFLSCFPPAPPAELAGMLRGALPNIVVLVITHHYESDQCVRAGDDTERVKPRIGEVRDTANPGRAFLQGIGSRFDKE